MFVVPKYGHTFHEIDKYIVHFFVERNNADNWRLAVGILYTYNILYILTYIRRVGIPLTIVSDRIWDEVVAVVIDLDRVRFCIHVSG